MVYFCCLSLWGNQDFIDFLQKNVFNIGHSNEINTNEID